MDSPDRRRRSRSGRLLDALVWGAALGAAAGAVLGAAIDGVGAARGRADRCGAVRARRGVHQPAPGRRGDQAALAPHRQQRPADGAVRLAAGPDRSTRRCWSAIVSGALLGLLGLRPLKVALGIAGRRRRGRAARSARRRRRAGAGRGGGHDRLSRGRGGRLSQPAAGPRDGRGGAGVRAALRRALRGPLAVRRRRLRRAARQAPRRDLPPQPARRRDPRLARQPRRPDLRRCTACTR